MINYRCGDCGTESPKEKNAYLARLAMKAAGWSRLYRGRGEHFRCPSCRNRFGRRS